MSASRELFMDGIRFTPNDSGFGSGAHEREQSTDNIPLAAYVRILYPRGPKPSPHLQALFKTGVAKLDDWMVDNVNLMTEGENPLYTLIYSAEEISGLQEGYSKRLKQVAEAHPHTHPIVACPMMGSWGIMDWQRRNGMDENSVVPVEINGAVGVETGEAQVRALFPPQVLDPKRYVIVADDVGDSFVSMLRVAGVRMRSRMNTKPDELTDVDTVIDEIEELKKIVRKEKPDDPDVWKDPRFGKLYKKAVSYLRSEHVVVAPFISKNKQFLDVLREEYQTHQRDEWSSMQYEMLKDQVEMDASMWITGGAGDGVWDGVRLFDIGKKLSDIRQYLPESLQRAIDAEGCADNVIVRLIARIPELLGLNHGVEGERRLMGILGPEIKRIMEEEISTI
ncbi:hypothetical protein A3D77_03855 [Candidatus Gottesmanbacteria bacterium RIFCSPHIGHO2_02_FULL_39_11]|uniref:Uncharacterized protein n=1 Tax=Candidatus Gottesmanbacteria bacterium RIFCSPHIGHO2_02_FULL_39_11 TaxID=1798382 RepID=A0A1F5ZKS7_9BACT|nr:MAG: hypothetical protein A3D77_03855 [Candidatus Gottesmanbacteria bacterium RIFCSPHIGHO2_02_FULL_39_11]